MRELLGVVAVVMLFPASGSAQAQVLDFEGIGDFVPVGNFYNGGAGGNAGVTFFGNAHALERVGFLVSDPCRGSSGFAPPPSGCGALFYYTGQTGSNAGLNVAAGFTTGFSLFSYQLYQTGNLPSLTVYSGSNGAGSVLGSVALPWVPFGSPVSWQPVGLTFAGTARSVVFTNAGGALVFDDVTLGSATPGRGGPSTAVPEPSAVALIGAGLGLLGIVARRRRRGAPSV